MQEAPSKPVPVRQAHSNIVLGIVMLGTLMGALDSTIVLLAFPAINDSLHSDLATSLWIILAYLLVLAVATTQMGRIGDIYGRSKIFNLGFVIFTVGSALCGFSPHIYLLIGFRVVQAVGGAILQATSGAIIADYFPRERRGRAYGLQFTWLHGWSVAWHSFRRNNHQLHQLAIHFLHKHSNRHNRGNSRLKVLKDRQKISAKLDLAGMGLLGSALVLLSFGLGGFCCKRNQRFNVVLAVIGAALDTCVYTV